MWKAIAGLIVLVVLLLGIKVMQIVKMASSPRVMPATTVTSAVVKEEDWAPRLSAIGSVSAVQGAMLSTDLAGTVAEVKFENGAVAKKGDVLVRLDASSEEGQLRTAVADLELARNDLARTRDLAARRVISKAELDAAESKFKQKEGAVGNMRAMVGKKEVRAPFDGQLGIRQVNIGQMINAGQQVVALTALDPVYVDFALPQQELSKLSAGFEVGQKALVVPGSAISYAPFGDSVFVIEKKKDPKTGKESQVIRQQFVRIGEARGDFVSITDGLKPNETIVSTGVFKLRNGMPVTINNDLAPKPQVNPTPVDS
ncbi:MAG: efflux transporter periplasmic adaptor subunit [Verrucomicrobia bacterium]|nr:MAG: efflux transporter periplasmic adaptor subunit [Verrucomicrobiota bacterium]